MEISTQEKEVLLDDILGIANMPDLIKEEEPIVEKKEPVAPIEPELTEEQKAQALADENAKKDAEKAKEPKTEPVVEEKSFLDILEDKPTDVAPVEVPEPVKVQLETITKERDEFKTKAEEIETKFAELEQSDLGKLLLSGLTLADVAQGIIKTDYSNHSVEDLIKLELEKTGLKDTELQNAIELEIATYQGLSPLQKAKYDSELKANYKSEIKFDDSLKLLDETLKKNAEKSKEVDPVIKQKALDIMKQSDLSEIDNQFKKVKEQGYQISDEDIKTIVAKYDAEEADMFYTNSEKKFDVNRWMKEKYILEFHLRDKQLAVEAAEKKAYEKAKKEFTNPAITSNSSNSSNTKPREVQLAENASIHAPINYEELHLGKK